MFMFAFAVHGLFLSLRLVNICVMSVLVYIKMVVIVCLLYHISIRLHIFRSQLLYTMAFRLDEPNGPWCNTPHRLITTRKIPRKKMHKMTSSLAEHRHDKHESQKTSLIQIH